MNRTTAPSAAHERLSPPPPEGEGTANGAPRSSLLRTGALTLLGLAAVLVVAALSITMGAKSLGPGEAWGALAQGPHVAKATEAHSIVWDFRLPRTLLGIIVGSSLAVAGALVQGFTRNPLADPGILGVNAGAALGVVLAIALLHIGATSALVWAAILGAGAASVVVVVVGSMGRGPSTPVRMTLAGIATAAFLSGIGAAIRLSNPSVFDRYRVWAAGSLVGRSSADAVSVLPFVAVGLVLALACARGLNAIALGEEMASALGARVRRTRGVSVIALTLLAGAATAVAGPIGFVGLMVPHALRWLLGPDHRVIVPLSALGGGGLLLASDVVARVLLGGTEVPVGVVTAFIGAPLLIALARRRRVNAL